MISFKLKLTSLFFQLSFLRLKYEHTLKKHTKNYLPTLQILYKLTCKKTFYDLKCCLVTVDFMTIRDENKDLYFDIKYKYWQCPLKSDPWQRYTLPPHNCFLDWCNRTGRKCRRHEYITPDDHWELRSRSKLEIAALYKALFLYGGGGYITLPRV